MTIRGGTAAWMAALAAATLMAFIALLGLRAPEQSWGCNKRPPCQETVQAPCPVGTESFQWLFEFNIPEEATDPEFTLRNAMGQATTQACTGATQSVSVQREDGTVSGEDKVKVTVGQQGVAGAGGTVNVTGELEWTNQADLEVDKDLYVGGRRVSDGLNVFADQELVFEVTVENKGPGLADNFVLADRTLGFQDTDCLITITKAVQVERTGVQPVEIEITNPVNLTHTDNGKVRVYYDELPAGAKRTIRITAKVLLAGPCGDIAAVERLGSNYNDPHSGNDFLEVTHNVTPVADSKVKAAGAGGISGTAKGAPSPRIARRADGDLRKVQVAILRLSGNLKGFSGQLPANPTTKSGSCKWLKSKGGAVTGRKPAKGGVCDSPVWLTASGDGSWKLKLKNDLPEGKYVAYSRAVGAGGAGETNFTKADGNRKEFRVR